MQLPTDENAVKDELRKYKSHANSVLHIPSMSLKVQDMRELQLRLVEDRKTSLHKAANLIIDLNERVKIPSNTYERSWMDESGSKEYIALQRRALQTHATVSFNHGSIIHGSSGNGTPDSSSDGTPEFYRHDSQKFASTFLIAGSRKDVRMMIYLINNWEMCPDILLLILNHAMKGKVMSINRTLGNKHMLRSIDWRSPYMKEEQAKSRAYTKHSTRREGTTPVIRHATSHVHDEVVEFTIHLLVNLAAKIKDLKNQKEKNNMTKFQRWRIMFLEGLKRYGLIQDPTNMDSSSDAQSSSGTSGTEDPSSYAPSDNESDGPYNRRMTEYGMLPAADTFGANGSDQQHEQPGMTVNEFNGSLFSKVANEDVKTWNMGHLMNDARYQAMFASANYLVEGSGIWNRLPISKDSRRNGIFYLPYRKQPIVPDFETLTQTAENLVKSINVLQMYENRLKINPWSNYSNMMDKLYDKHALNFMEKVLSGEDDGMMETSGSTMWRKHMESQSVLPVNEVAWIGSMNTHSGTLTADGNQAGGNQPYSKPNLASNPQNIVSKMLSIQTFQTPVDKGMAFAKIVSRNYRMDYLYEANLDQKQEPVTTTAVSCARIRLESSFDPVVVQGRNNTLYTKNNMHHPALINTFIQMALEDVKKLAIMEENQNPGRVYTKKKEDLERKIKELREESSGDSSENSELQKVQSAKANLENGLKTYKTYTEDLSEGNLFVEKDLTQVVGMETIQITPCLFFFWIRFNGGAETGMAVHTSVPYTKPGGIESVPPFKIPRGGNGMVNIMKRLRLSLKADISWYTSLGFDKGTPSEYFKVSPDNMEDVDIETYKELTTNKKYSLTHIFDDDNSSDSEEEG
jgi:hypothetical protein